MKNSMRKSLWCTAIAALIVIPGCRGDVSHEGKLDEPLGVSRAALTAGSQSVTLSYPAGFGLGNSAIGSSDSLNLGDRVKVLAANGSPGNATNAGSGSTIVGNDDVDGTVASVGALQARDRVQASALLSAGQVTEGNQDNVGTATSHASLLPLVQRTITVPVLPASPTNADFEPSQQGSLPPGPYGSVAVKTARS